MSSQCCVECGLTFDLSRFVPRHNSQYDELPTMDEVWRQPRCDECNKLYHRRRSFFRDRITELAENHGVVVRARRGSVFRIVEVDGADADREALRALHTLVDEFNDSLPPKRCDLRAHGITLELTSARARQLLFPLKARQSK